jgi:leucyl-tRNA synthetase
LDARATFTSAARNTRCCTLYARFWHKVLFDLGLVSTPEPFKKLFNQGMILAYSYRDASGKYFHPKDVEEKDGKAFVKGVGTPLDKQVAEDVEVEVERRQPRRSHRRIRRRRDAPL